MAGCAEPEGLDLVDYLPRRGDCATEVYRRTLALVNAVAREDSQDAAALINDLITSLQRDPDGGIEQLVAQVYALARTAVGLSRRPAEHVAVATERALLELMLVGPLTDPDLG